MGYISFSKAHHSGHEDALMNLRKSLRVWEAVNVQSVSGKPNHTGVLPPPVVMTTFVRVQGGSCVTKAIRVQ